MNPRKKIQLALLAATTLVVAACGGGSGGDDPMPPAPQNTAPAISAITDKAGNQDTVVGPIEFGITDRETASSQLTVTAATDANGLFAADGVTLSGAGATRAVTLTPLEAATGSATVTLRVTDADGAAATRSFLVTVNARGASMRDTALSTFSKSEADDVTVVNGFTFDQDADDPAVFAGLIPVE